MSEFRVYGVSERSKQPLVDFMVGALRSCGCRILFTSSADQAPFRITFETSNGERMGIVAYAFLANQKKTTNLPDDEHRFQVKYGKKTGEPLVLWQDPHGLYTTLFLGINPERGFFVAADPVFHSPTKMFISVEFKEEHVAEVLRDGWASWEREHRGPHASPVEVLVGGTPESFLRLVRLEREAFAEDPGHRQLLAERSSPLSAYGLPLGTSAEPSARTLHTLSVELCLSEKEVLDMIERAPRLKMAVRGWVAEVHLRRALEVLPGVANCEAIESDGHADVALVFEGAPLTVECKNVLRRTTAAGLARVDFQRTRASKGDPCTRYYGPDEFDVVAACLHAQTERWEFRYVVPGVLAPHKKCEGKLASNVKVNDQWTAEAVEALRTAARR